MLLQNTEAVVTMLVAQTFVDALIRFGSLPRSPICQLIIIAVILQPHVTILSWLSMVVNGCNLKKTSQKEEA